MSDHDPQQRPAAGRIPSAGRPPPRTAARGNLLWTWVTAIAVVFILVVVFYGISAQRTYEDQSGSAAVTASPAPSTGAPPAAPDSTAGQGGARDQATTPAPSQGPPANQGTR